MKILVIGESCKDVFIYGKCDRLSPEAPVAVLNLKEKVESDGMALNVAANIMAIAKEAKVNVFCQNEQMIKTRYVEKKSNHIFLRVDEAPEKISNFSWGLDTASKIKKADAVIVSDYNKGFLSDDDLIKISKLAKWSIIDSKRIITEEIIAGFNFVKLNEREYKECGLNNNKIIVTVGGNGANFGGKTYPVKEQQTIDVSGAGDTFVAAFTVGFLRTNNIVESIEYANDMASLVVTKRGVSTP